MKSPFDFVRAVPDDDPIMKEVPNGEAQAIDGVLYVRKSDWLPLLRMVWNHKSDEPCPF